MATLMKIAIAKVEPLVVWQQERTIYIYIYIYRERERERERETERETERERLLPHVGFEVKEKEPSYN